MMRRSEARPHIRLIYSFTVLRGGLPGGGLQTQGLGHKYS
jgi:hypothetical protein